MGLFDFFKKDRGYDIHSLEFCEVGKDGKKETRPGLRLYDDARYVMPVVRMTSRVERTVQMTVRITNPEGVVRTYTLDAPLRPFENQEAHLSWWGSESRTAFSKTGTWRFEVLDENDEVVIEAPLEIAPEDEIWEGTGWIHVTTHLEFRNIDYSGNAIDDWGTKSFVEPQYIQMRCGYTCYSKVERKVTYHVEIEHEQSMSRRVEPKALITRPRSTPVAGGCRCAVGARNRVHPTRRGVISIPFLTRGSGWQAAASKWRNRPASRVGSNPRLWFSISIIPTTN